MSDVNDPFADMEVDWKNTEKARPGMSAGRLPEFHSYRGVCVQFDPKGDSNFVDHEFLTPVNKSKGVKIMIEILEPEKVGEETVQGRTYEHVFWITPPNWPFVKRDSETILGTEPGHPSELLSAVWTGKTVEFGLRDELYNGFLRSKSTHFNAWSPDKKDEKKEETKKVSGPNKGAAKSATTSKSPVKAAAPAGAKKPVDF